MNFCDIKNSLSSTFYHRLFSSHCKCLNLQLRAELQERHDLLNPGLRWCNDSIKQISSSHFMGSSNNLMQSKPPIVTNQPLDNLAPIPFPSSPLISRMTQYCGLESEQSRLYVEDGGCWGVGLQGKATVMK